MTWVVQVAQVAVVVISEAGLTTTSRSENGTWKP
jgi:hypothetical protein